MVVELKVQNQQFAEERNAPADKLVKSEMMIANLKDREARSKMLAIAEFKSSSDFQEAVKNAISKYFGQGFDFYERQLVVHHPNLGIDLDAIDMDHELLEKEERKAKEGEEIREDEQEKGEDNINPLSP